METRLQQKVAKKNPSDTVVMYGSVTYVSLCYAKMKRGYFTARNFRDFQLNREEHCKDINTKLEYLYKNGLLEKEVINKVNHYKITPHGEHKLILIAEVHRKKVEKLQKAYAMKGYLTKQANLGEDPRG